MRLSALQAAPQTLCGVGADPPPVPLGALNRHAGKKARVTGPASVWRLGQFTAHVRVSSHLSGSRSELCDAGWGKGGATLCSGPSCPHLLAPSLSSTESSCFAFPNLLHDDGDVITATVLVMGSGSSTLCTQVASHFGRHRAPSCLLSYTEGK